MAAIPDLVLSDPTVADIEIYRGDTGRFRVTVTTDTGAGLDVSAAVWLCQARANYDATVILASFGVIPVGGDVSSIDVVLNAVSSAALVDGAVWDLQMIYNGDTITLLTGSIALRPDVSRTGV